MGRPEHFQITGSQAEYRPVGQVTFREAIALMCGAIVHARESRVGKMLVDTRGLGGFPPPTTMERFELGKECADAANGAVIVAVVAKEEMIDPKRFGVVVARNRAMTVEVFTDEPAALAWLLAAEAVVPPGPA
jgi:hypothetical protein